MAGMVCMKSRTGFMTALTRSDRAAQMPSGIANTRVTSVATRTSESVDMASDQSPTESTSAKPAKASPPASRPRSHQAAMARMPANSSGAGAERTATSPS